jgi:cation:H+ antiporter
LIAQLLILLGGVVALYFGAEWLVRGAARLAASLGVTPIAVGLTVVSFGTSAPELVVATVATLKGNGDLAVGNVLGSNLANLGLILGITAVIVPLKVSGTVLRREVPVMLLITAMMYPVMGDLVVSRSDGVILLVTLVAYLVFVLRSASEETDEVVGEYERFARALANLTGKSALKDMALIAAGSVGLVVGGEAIVDSATFLAQELGVSDLVIGLTLVAVGTSLPELATSVVAALRKEADIAVGNVIGSNIFNLTAVLGTASVIRPFGVAETVLAIELPAVILLSVLVLPLARPRFQIRRWEGVILLMCYLILTTWVVVW